MFLHVSECYLNTSISGINLNVFLNSYVNGRVDSFWKANEMINLKSFMMIPSYAFTEKKRTIFPVSSHFKYFFFSRGSSVISFSNANVKHA